MRPPAVERPRFPRGIGNVTRWAALVAAAWGLAVAGPAVAAVAWPRGFEAEVVAEGFDLPTALAVSPDGRVFVAEKGGRVRVVPPGGGISPVPFVSIPVDTANDRGLVGLALHPDFPSTPWVYLAATSTDVPSGPLFPLSRIHRITRWSASGDVALPGSEARIVDDIPSDADSHAGGALRFGADGYLYATVGDGSPYPYVNPWALRALDPDQLVGKVLRVGADGAAPVDNPFFAGPKADRSKVWQLGLRNPFRAAMRPGTSELWIADVGWRTWEEVDTGPAGANFGWPCREGFEPQPLYAAAYPEFCGSVASVVPAWTWGRTSDGAAASGAAFLAGPTVPPKWAGRLLVADYAQQWIRALGLSHGGAVESVVDFAVGDGAFRPVDLAVTPDGTLWVLEIATDFGGPSGRLTRVSWVGEGNRAPRVAATATPSFGGLPLAVTFDASGSFDPDGDPLDVTWCFDDGGTSVGPVAGRTFAEPGSHLATVEVSDGAATRRATVTVVAGSHPPVPAIAAPAEGFRFVAGEAVAFAGGAVDPEEGTLGAGALRWAVLQHHGAHVHPFLDAVGTGASFVAEVHGDDGAPTWYELVLAATDGSGLTTLARRELFRACAPEEPRPPAVAGLGFAGASEDRLAWIPVPGAIGYELFRAPLDDLTEGEFELLGTRLAGSSASDPDRPAPGEGFAYLVRAVGECGAGPLGGDDDGDDDDAPGPGGGSRAAEARGNGGGPGGRVGREGGLGAGGLRPAVPAAGGWGPGS